MITLKRNFIENLKFETITEHPNFNVIERLHLNIF